MTTDREDLVHQIDEDLARLSEFSLAELRVRWLQLKGVPLPKFMRRGLMSDALAHAIKEAAFGGLDPKTQKRLQALVRQIVPKGVKPPPPPNRIKIGTRLIREWQGAVHEVTVAADGFVWKGERHASLSAIARLITGTQWNGWLFFGLKKRRNPTHRLEGPSSQARHRRSPDAKGGAAGAPDAPPRRLSTRRGHHTSQEAAHG